VNDSPDPKQVADATGVLALLQDQADSVRAELLGLRQELAQAEREFSATRGAALLEANQQLVLAAMRAQAIADTASSKLDELVRSGVSAGLGSVSTHSSLPGIEQEDDIRDLRDANEQLVLAALEAKEMEATAQAAYHRQIAFLATVAHELRNPLMPLRLAAHMLSRARMDEAVHAKLQATITGQVSQITRLINDLLDGSRITTGKFRLERTVVELSGIVDLAIETCRPVMDARNHRFKFIMPPQPIKVLADSVRLAQVLGNLLGNAAKYTPEGGEISLQATVLLDTVSITVSDNGIGISAPALSQVFDLFVQDKRATVISPGGLGIGLAVVRELVKAHEGTVVARSAGPDLGSQFIVTLPLARREAAPAGAA
jgi:signal transduction histidine kinase